MNHEIDVTYSTIDPASIDRLCISFIWKFFFIANLVSVLTALI